MRRPAWLTALLQRPLYLLLAAALVLLAAWGFWPRGLPVEVADVARGPLTVGFTEEGRTRLRDRYVVSAPVDGRIERIELEPGDGVRTGATVAVLRPTHGALFDPVNRAEAEARWRAAIDEFAAAQAEVAAATAMRERLDAALRRAQSLASQQLVARDQLDEARAQSTSAAAALRSARARAMAARVQRDSARAVLDLQGAASNERMPRLPLASPVDGRVIRRHVESEGVVRTGQPLLDIGDPHRIEVIVEALTADAMRLRPGARVRLLRWGGDDPLPAHVERIEPGGFTKVSALGVEEQRVLVVVALERSALAQALGDGYRVDAEFQVWHADDVLTVPVAALFRDGPYWAVYAVDDGRARLRRLRVGQIGDDAAQVLSGLREGEAVVLYPGDRLHDGTRISAQRP